MIFTLVAKKFIFILLDLLYFILELFIEKTGQRENYRILHYFVKILAH